MLCVSHSHMKMDSHTCDTVTLTYLHVRLLAKVYNNSPTKVSVFIFYLCNHNKETLSDM